MTRDEMAINFAADLIKGLNRMASASGEEPIDADSTLEAELQIWFMNITKPRPPKKAA